MSFLPSRASKWDFGISGTKGLRSHLSQKAGGASAETPLEVLGEIEGDRVEQGLMRELSQN